MQNFKDYNLSSVFIACLQIAFANLMHDGLNSDI